MKARSAPLRLCRSSAQPHSRRSASTPLPLTHLAMLLLSAGMIQDEVPRGCFFSSTYHDKARRMRQRARSLSCAALLMRAAALRARTACPCHDGALRLQAGADGCVIPLSAGASRRTCGARATR
jgi:hypothetical protein